MNLRESFLSQGWYPRDPAAIAGFLSAFDREPAEASAVIAPHAGWFYSGKIAAKAIASLDRNARTVVIAGGHLPEGTPPLFALEDAVSTPQGPMPVDVELRDLLLAELGGREDRYMDNTVEVLVPMVRFFFPEAALLWMRLPAEIQSFEAGKTIARAARQLKRHICFAASTDLTHYGVNYGYAPAGRGKAALDWVSGVNDARFIRTVLDGKPEAVLETAAADLSCCSAGAVLGALGFAAVSGKTARLLEYGTSAARDKEIPDSFVGYAALAFE